MSDQQLPAALGQRVVFVVDDDDAVLNSLRFTLEIEGYAVRLFSSDKALLDEPVLPDSGCLVLDLKLPDRDGLAVLAELRGRGVTMPAILITSVPTESIRRRAAEAGVPIVEKPIFGNGLIDTIRAAFSAA